MIDRVEFRHEWEASYTLDRQIAEAREQMGAERWSELCAEWEIEPARVLTREQS